MRFDPGGIFDPVKVRIGENQGMSRGILTGDDYVSDQILCDDRHGLPETGIKPVNQKLSQNFSHISYFPIFLVQLLLTET